MSLGGILLCITGIRAYNLHHCNSYLKSFTYNISLNASIFPGSEAMFADLGHFSQLSIKVDDVLYNVLDMIDLSPLLQFLIRNLK